MALSGAALLAAPSSRACGGCFGPASAVSTVTGHRMAFAVSEERTVLWDQFEYSGAPEDFSWVLPVLPDAVLEESTDAWFESLETMTQVTVSSPSVVCAQSGDSGCGLGGLARSASDSSGAAGFVGGGGVMVLHRGTVGPYETVTLRSVNGDALTEWLTGHGYFIPPEIEPVIGDYVAEGKDFIAVRLQPDKTVSQMTPVRVVTPGGEGLLPLRMVAAGVGQAVNIVLYVIGEKRYAMPDLQEVAVDSDDIQWTFADNSSNYPELRRDALAEHLGYSYLPTFAFKGAFSRELPGPAGGIASYSVDGSFSTIFNFADLYFAQARSNDNGAGGNGTQPLCPEIKNTLKLDEPVSETDAAGTIGRAELECEKYTDIAAALVGLRPASTWITRLELLLPKEALSMDCTVLPDESQAEVSNQLQAVHAKDRPAGCDEAIFESKLARGVPGRGGALVVLGVLGSLLWLRRRGGVR